MKRTIRIDDVSELGAYVRQTSGGETIFICSWCPEASPDKRGHLYVNQVKGVGECKRCGITIVLHETPSQLRQKFLDFEQSNANDEGGEDEVGVTVSSFAETTRKLGFAPISPSYDHEYLHARNIRPEIAMEAKVAYKEKTNELLFPFLNPSDLTTVSGWSTRSKDRGWVNTKSARKNLYVPTAAIMHSPYLVVVEGIADALSLYSRGFPAVAICGTTMTPLQLRQLLRRSPNSVDIFLDKDATNDALRLSSVITTAARTKGLTCDVNIVECPLKDPAELSWEELVEALNSEVEPPKGPNYIRQSQQLRDLDTSPRAASADEQPKPNGGYL